MSKTRSRSVVTLDSRSAITRFLFFLPALLALFGCWFAVRWYVGNTVAEYAGASEQDAIEMARLATRWAPSDPFTHWQLGALAEKSFSAGNLAEAAREYRLAVTSSPYDYRYWMELGGGLENVGDDAGSEQALRRAVDLAPSYAQPHWFLGNLLLREGKLNEGFEQVRQAALADPQMQSQLMNLAWQAFGGDVDQIVKMACPTPNLRVQLAIYLVARNKIDDSIRIWNSLSKQDKVQQSDLANGFKQALLNVGQFSGALAVTRDTHPAAPAAEQFWDGGFEGYIATGNSDPFFWIVESRPQTQIDLDPDRPHNGRRSLRIVFSVPTKLETISLSQTVVVQANSQYHLEFFVRTRDLNTGSTPIVSLVDARDNVSLGNSAAAPNGTSDWQKAGFDFKTKTTTQAVKLVIFRESCGENQICPIFGKVWYDDFSLQRGGRARDPR